MIGDCRSQGCDCKAIAFVRLRGKAGKKNPATCRRCTHDHAIVDKAAPIAASPPDGWEGLYQTARDLVRLAGALLVELEQLRARGVTVDDFTKKRAPSSAAPKTPFPAIFRSRETPPAANAARDVARASPSLADMLATMVPASEAETQAAVAVFESELAQRPEIKQAVAAFESELTPKPAPTAPCFDVYTPADIATLGLGTTTDALAAGIAAELARAPLTDAERKILTVLAQRRDGRSKKAIASLAGYAPNGGSFGASIRELAARGFLAGDVSRYTITPSGLDKLGDFVPLALLPLEPSHRKILAELARHPHGRSKKQIAALCGYAHKGGTFGAHLRDLVDRGWIAGSAKAYAITTDGRERLGPDGAPPPARGRAALEHWIDRLATTERRVLEELAAAYPHALSKDEIAARTGYTASGGTFGEAIRMLRDRALIHANGGTFQLSEELAS